MQTFPIVLGILAAVVGVIYFFVSRNNSTPHSTTSTNTPGRTQTLPDSDPDFHKPNVTPTIPAVETGDDLMANTKNQLLDMARERGVKVSVRMSKSNIAAAIRSHEETNVSE